MSISLRGNGFEPELPPPLGEAVADGAGEAAMELVDEAVLVMRRVATPESGRSLCLRVSMVLPLPGGKFDDVGLAATNPAASPVATGIRNVPALIAGAARGFVPSMVRVPGCESCLAISKLSFKDKRSLCT